jgi:spore maturation protein CgeB
MLEPMQIVILGLSITSSWGNGHATTYRGLVRALEQRGHHILFLERDVPWYAGNRDMPEPPFGQTHLYSSLDDLRERFGSAIHHADLVIVGSYVPEGVAIGQWVTEHSQGIRAFYDIDTPVTLTKLRQGDYEYLTPDLVSRYDLYLSFAGGSVLDILQQQYGSPMARPLYCAIDPDLYFPESDNPHRHDLGYMGTYSADRQPRLEELLLEPARCCPMGQFVVAGPQYPADVAWPDNVQRIEHLSPVHHRQFYTTQRFTLNLTRTDMVKAGFSPGVRLFEAAACGTPIMSDYWQGLDTFFASGEEICIVHSAADVLHLLQTLPEDERQAIGMRARKRVLEAHTAAHRAAELEQYVAELRPGIVL